MKPFSLSFAARILTLLSFVGTFAVNPQLALAGDGATEALELRYQAELAIAEERAHGNRSLASAMQEALPNLLNEYLATRDGSIALDAVDSAFTKEEMKVAKAMEEPGVALALDVFTGPGDGFEHGLRTSIANLADFNDRMFDRVSEAALDAHERVMRDHLEKIETRLADFERLDAKLDAADLDRRTLEKSEAKVEFFVQQAETKIETIVEQAEAKVENVVGQLETKIEAQPEKVDSFVAKAETKIEQIVSQAEKKIDQVVESAVQKIEVAASTTPTESDSPGKGKGKK